VRIVPVDYEHPDAQALVAEVQQEYVTIYGEEDETPVQPADFRPPRGLFLVGYLDDRAVACGGWRAHDDGEDGLQAGDAELKRMYVVPAARRRGLARQLLAELERTAALAGRKRVVLETGAWQPEAIELYRSSGYHQIAGFGVYRDDPLARHFAKELTE
jgi:GNAT superfamily N-acetyltransferase